MKCGLPVIYSFAVLVSTAVEITAPRTLEGIGSAVSPHHFFDI